MKPTLVAEDGSPTQALSVPSTRAYAMKRRSSASALTSSTAFSTLNSGLRDETDRLSVAVDQDDPFSTLNSGLRDETSFKASLDNIFQSLSVPSTRAYAMKLRTRGELAARTDPFSTLNSGLRDETISSVPAV